MTFTPKDLEDEIKSINDTLKSYPALQFIAERALMGYVFPISTVHHQDPSTIAFWDKISMGSSDETRFKKWIKELKDYTMVTYGGLISLIEQIRYCEENQISGDLVECGCWKGGAAALMGKASIAFGQKARSLHLFDSFEGIPRPDWEKDDKTWIQESMFLTQDQCDGKLTGTGCLGAEESFATEALDIVEYPAEKYTIHKGWFQDTVPHAKSNIDQIALLRLDGDLYESYYVCLEEFYPKVSKGGIVVFDDWCISGAKQAILDYFKGQSISPFIHRVDNTVRYVMKD